MRHSTTIDNKDPSPLPFPIGIRGQWVISRDSFGVSCHSLSQLPMRDTRTTLNYLLIIIPKDAFNRFNNYHLSTIKLKIFV